MTQPSEDPSNPEDYKKLFVLDAPDAGQISEDNIPGAVAIDRRKMRAEPVLLPKNRVSQRRRTGQVQRLQCRGDRTNP
jgi:hypothetical protein